MIFVLHLEKRLYGKFFNGVWMVYTILNPLEKRKQQLGLYGHRKKINRKHMIKTVSDNFFYQIKTLSKTYFMQNVLVWFIRRNLEILAFLLWYRSNEFPVIRLPVHQAVEQDNEEHSSCLYCNVRCSTQLWCTTRTS